jgi:hypothetical protein
VVGDSETARREPPYLRDFLYDFGEIADIFKVISFIIAGCKAEGIPEDGMAMEIKEHKWFFFIFLQELSYCRLAELDLGDEQHLVLFE